MTGLVALIIKSKRRRNKRKRTITMMIKIMITGMGKLRMTSK